MPHRWLARVLAASFVLGAVSPPTATARAPDAAEAAVRHTPPVTGPVVVGFSAPADPYAPGHRGVDLAVSPGAPVRAGATGIVTFAGAVAGTRWVTLRSADGIRTTVGPLAEVAVAVGERIVAGSPVGTALGRAHTPPRGVLHVSARTGERYLDPTRLWSTGAVASLVGPGGWWSTDPPPRPEPYPPWRGRVLLGALTAASPVAEGPGWAFPPTPNAVLTIAGLESSSADVDPFDVTHLGYDADDVTAFSYAGTGRPYDREDTSQGVRAAAARLRDQLRAQWAREPGRAVDIVGHSLGGVVAAYYLTTMHDPTDPELPPIGTVVTIAAPLQGTDAATAARMIAGDDDAVALAAALAGAAGQRLPDVTAPALADLVPGSPVVRTLAARWDEARDRGFAGPLATGTRLVTLGANLDLVVPEHRTDLPGAPHVVLPGTHDSVRATEAVRQVVRAALAGEPLPGAGGGIEHLASYRYGQLQQDAGALVRWIGEWWPADDA